MGPPYLEELAGREDAERLEHVGDEPRDRRLARAGVALEDHVQRRALLREEPHRLPLLRRPID
jgi:hypothetical protein